MPSLIERCQTVVDKLHYSPAVLPFHEPIPSSQVDKSLGDQPFQPGKHYFLVRINELYLDYSREWFTTYLPMVLAVSEFWYGGEKLVVPFVVGPSMLEQNGIKVPNKGMVFYNTRVAGMHPYRGERLILTVMLCRGQRNDFIRRLLQVVENVASALDFSTALGSYLKIANVVLDGVEALFDMGQVTPVMGIRQEFDPDAHDHFVPGYHVLVNTPEAQLTADKLWVRDRQLTCGDSPDKAKSYRDADYVLYSINQEDTRSDVAMLPFYPLWQKIAKEAKNPSEEYGKNARVNMVSLWQTIGESPDLTEDHGDKLIDGYYEELERLRKKAEERAPYGGPGKDVYEAPRTTQMRSKSLAILNT